MNGRQRKHLIELHNLGGITVVYFTTSTLREQSAIIDTFHDLDQLIDTGCTRLVINFNGLQGIASYAIGKMIGLNNRLQPPLGRLALCCLTPSIEEIIDIMSLRKLFNIYPSEQAALESFVG